MARCEVMQANAKTPQATPTITWTRCLVFSADVANAVNSYVSLRVLEASGYRAYAPAWSDHFGNEERQYVALRAAGGVILDIVAFDPENPLVVKPVNENLWPALIIALNALRVERRA